MPGSAPFLSPRVSCCPIIFTKALSLSNTTSPARCLPTPSFFTFKILRSFFTPEDSQPPRAHGSVHTTNPVPSDQGEATAEKEEEVTVASQSLCCSCLAPKPTCHNFASLFVHRVIWDADESLPECLDESLPECLASGAFCDHHASAHCALQNVFLALTPCCSTTDPDGPALW